jgi:hypothetical protein
MDAGHYNLGKAFFDKTLEFPQNIFGRPAP